MSRQIFLTDALADYVASSMPAEMELLQRLREETVHTGHLSMQIGPEQGRFMGLLVKLIGAKRTLEIGVFTGYSSLSVAMALPAGGKLIACDVSEEWTSIARRYWFEAGVAGKIDLRLGPAMATLDSLIEEGQTGAFDFAFIDADKENYAGYYERALRLLRKGGLVAVDNVLWSGQVIDPTADDTDTKAIRSFNDFVRNDSRVCMSLLPVGDGLTLAMKL